MNTSTIRHQILAIGMAILTLSGSTISMAAERPFTILHTNDWQSRLLGFGPNVEYTPMALT